MSERDPAVANHAIGDFGAALTIRLANATPIETDPEWPGQQAAIALTQERLGIHDKALEYANKAFEAPTFIPGESGHDAEVREKQRPSTDINVGIVFLRAAARRRLRGRSEAPEMQERATKALGAAFVGILAQRQNGRVHQHQINLASRLSNAEAVDGIHGRAFRNALGATALGFISESSLFVDHTSGLKPVERLYAKTKAVWRGLGAMGVALLSAIPGPRAASMRDKALLKTS